MGRREGSRTGRALPGLAAALIGRYEGLDRAYHLPGGCHWCAQLAALRVGQPVMVEPDTLHAFVDHGEFRCSGPFTHDDEGAFLVTGDRYERVS